VSLTKAAGGKEYFQEGSEMFLILMRQVTWMGTFAKLINIKFYISLETSYTSVKRLRQQFKYSTVSRTRR
jgi:hypothetical protein